MSLNRNLTHKSGDDHAHVGVKDSGFQRQIQDGFAPDLVVGQEQNVLHVGRRLEAVESHSGEKKSVKSFLSVPV